MILKFDIPEGTMTIDCWVFFREEKAAQIRKGMKLYKRSNPDEIEVKRLMDYLEAQIRTARNARYFCQTREENCERQLADLIEAYKNIRDPEQKEDLKNRISEMKEKIRYRKSEVRACQRPLDRLKKAQDIVKETFE